MPDERQHRRDRTYLAGHRAEWIALIWLLLHGYRILAQRYRVQGGEIDLVARRGGLVIFVEVKARPSHDEALLALTETKRRRIRRAASVWLARNAWAATWSMRGDALLIAPRRLPRHVEDAFDLGIG